MTIKGPLFAVLWVTITMVRPRDVLPSPLLILNHRGNIFLIMDALEHEAYRMFDGELQRTLVKDGF